MTGDVKRFYVRHAKTVLFAVRDKLENIKPSLGATAEKADYDLLVKRLTEEFTDNHERQLFNENMEFNRRKKGQRKKEKEVPLRIAVGVSETFINSRTFVCKTAYLAPCDCEFCVLYFSL